MTFLVCRKVANIETSDGGKKRGRGGFLRSIFPSFHISITISF